MTWPRTRPRAASARPSAITDHSGTSGKCCSPSAIATQNGDQNPASPIPRSATIATRLRSGSGAFRSCTGARIACAPTTSTEPMTLAPYSVAVVLCRGSRSAIRWRVRAVSGRRSAVVRRTTRVTKKAAKVVASFNPPHSARQSSEALRTICARSAESAAGRIVGSSPSSERARIVRSSSRRG